MLCPIANSVLDLANGTSPSGAVPIVLPTCPNSDIVLSNMALAIAFSSSLFPKLGTPTVYFLLFNFAVGSPTK